MSWRNQGLGEPEIVAHRPEWLGVLKCKSRVAIGRRCSIESIPRLGLTAKPRLALQKEVRSKRSAFCYRT